MQCVILAGGLATRMRPITESIPKALIVADGRPFVDHQLAWLGSHGVTDVVLAIGYRGDMLRAHVGDGARFGVRVRYVDEGTELRGTAGALRLAADQGALDSELLVTYGDSFLPIDFGEVFEAFRASGKPALMTVYRNAGRWDTSNVVFDDGRVRLYDKQRRGRPAQDFAYIDYGLSAFRRSLILDEVPSGQKADLADVFNALSLRGELAGLEVSERFYEIGSPAGLEDFAAWLRRKS
jgi:N-acetyl-alpha-D-muramate 1-phosphate uridylyltransferase